MLTVHPIFSNLSFKSSASGFLIPFFKTQGTFSTSSLASLRPKFNIVLTSLIILIFAAASNLANSISKFCFSSTGFASAGFSAAAAAPPAGAPPYGAPPAATIPPPKTLPNNSDIPYYPMGHNLAMASY